MRKLAKLGLGILVGFGLMVSGQTMASAQDVSNYRETVRDYQTKLTDLKKEANDKKIDISRYNSEISTISEWIEQSQILMNNNDTAQVKALVIKTGVYLDYVVAGVAKDSALMSAMSAESELKALKAEFGKLDAEVQQLEAEDALLTKQLESLKK